jgi:hypothetical protein
MTTDASPITHPFLYMISGCTEATFMAAARPPNDLTGRSDVALAPASASSRTAQIRLQIAIVLGAITIARLAALYVSGDLSRARRCSWLLAARQCYGGSRSAGI